MALEPNLDLEHKYMIDKLFMITNLAFLKYIKYPIRRDSIKVHNRAANDWRVPKIDPDKLEYIEEDDSRYKDL